MGFDIVEKFKDKKLKERIKNRDQEAFEILYEQNADHIYRFIFFKIGKKEEAADLSSLAFLKTWEHIQKKSLKEKDTLRALLYKIARNIVIDHYRENKKDNLSLDDENNRIDIVDESSDIERDASNQFDYEVLSNKMMELKNEYREVLVMRYVNDLSLDEISQISGKKKINVRVLLHRATKALKEIMNEK
ncbi:MAG: RNA polymerase sigma factor [Patescibacteria group bacterium]